MPVYCSHCGGDLRDPEEDLQDPEGVSDVAQQLGIAPDPDDPHIRVVQRKDGEVRYQCLREGKQLTSIVDHPPENGYEGEGDRSDDQRNSPPQPVYEINEPKPPMTVLAETVTNEAYGLNELQVEEIKEWADIYEGHLPPDMLESIAKNLNGVADQTAVLMRQKYEAKLNHWTREQYEDDQGPPIGVQPTPVPGRDTPDTSGATQTRRSPPQKPDPQRQSVDQPRDSSTLNGRKRRVNRRNEALDIVAEEAARQAAQEAAGDMVREFSRYFGLPAKIIEAKIEKDPDWAIEKLEQWDLDLDIFLEPSDKRKEEIREEKTRPAANADREAERALEEVKGSNVPEQPQEPQIEDEEDDFPEIEQMKEPDDESEQFEDIFGEGKPMEQ